MRRAAPVLLLALALAACEKKSPTTAEAAGETLRVRIEGMTCENCAKSISRSVRKLPGILATDIHFSNQVQIVSYKPERVKEPDLIAAITNLGFTVAAAPASP